MHQAQKVATVTRGVQKEAHYKIALARRLAWYTDQGPKATIADCTHAVSLIKGLSGQYLFVDRGYDLNTIIDQAKSQGMISLILPRKNRKEI